MNLSKKFKSIKRKGISEMLFIAFAVIAVVVTVIIAFG
jgi:hypothetical protein